MFENFTGRMWNEYYRALNEELPPEKCGLKLTHEEREAYLKSAATLKKERAANPGIPISYPEDAELEWE